MGGYAQRDLPGTDSASALRAKRPIQWVFLDRDGTINVQAPEGDYVERPSELELLPGAAEAVKLLNRAKLWTGVVTNQRGVALGRMSAQDVDAVHERLAYLLGLEGAFLDAVYTCPHEAGSCDCRKPEPGMLLEAQREHPGLDFGHAAIVGDSLSDMQAGWRLGLVTVRIADSASERTSPAGERYEAGHLPPDFEGTSLAGERHQADHLAPDLLTAVRWLLGGRLNGVL
jgi:D-glycero-D-manno-heptose 1,7-bisphosphate phosphatase